MRRRHLGWPGGAQTGAAFGVGLVMATGQAPLGFWFLAWPALVALIALMARAAGPGQAAWIGLFAALGHFGLALSWLVEPFLIDIARHGWMAPFAVVLMAGGLGLFWAAAAAAGHRAGQGRLRPLALAGALAAAELARGYVLTGFPWAMIGHVWIDTPVAQVAALAGPSGLTLLTTVSAALPLMLGGAGVAAGLALLGAAAVFGFLRLSAPDPADRPVMLRLVQPNAAQEDKWDPDRARMFFQRQLDYTAAAPRPDLVIWPETAVPWLLDQSPELAPIIAEAAGGATVVLGVQRSEGARFWNSLAVIAPDGTVGAVHDKHHLVPFGEYIPFGDLASEWFGLTAFAARDGNAYSAGPGPALVGLGSGLGRVLPLICYEAVFPQDLRGLPARPDWLLQITNDAWFGTLTGPYQHFAQARLRAIEQGLPLVRVANTGVSGVIDAKGRVRDRIALGQAAWRDAPLPGVLPQPPYARWGEGPVLLLLAGLAGVLGWFLRRNAGLTAPPGASTQV
jgi:apolipoprotein N-acyltransferase